MTPPGTLTTFGPGPSVHDKYFKKPGQIPTLDLGGSPGSDSSSAGTLQTVRLPKGFEKFIISGINPRHGFAFSANAIRSLLVSAFRKGKRLVVKLGDYEIRYVKKGNRQGILITKKGNPEKISINEVLANVLNQSSSLSVIKIILPAILRALTVGKDLKKKFDSRLNTVSNNRELVFDLKKLINGATGVAEPYVQNSVKYAELNLESCVSLRSFSSTSPSAPAVSLQVYSPKNPLDPPKDLGKYVLLAEGDYYKPEHGYLSATRQIIDLLDQADGRLSLKFVKGNDTYVIRYVKGAIKEEGRNVEVLGYVVFKNGKPVKMPINQVLVEVFGKDKDLLAVLKRIGQMPDFKALAKVPYVREIDVSKTLTKEKVVYRDIVKGTVYQDPYSSPTTPPPGSRPVIKTAPTAAPPRVPGIGQRSAKVRAVYILQLLAGRTLSRKNLSLAKKIIYEKGFLTYDQFTKITGISRKDLIAALSRGLHSLNGDKKITVDDLIRAYDVISDISLGTKRSALDVFNAYKKAKYLTLRDLNDACKDLAGDKKALSGGEILDRIPTAMRATAKDVLIRLFGPNFSKRIIKLDQLPTFALCMYFLVSVFANPSKGGTQGPSKGGAKTPSSKAVARGFTKWVKGGRVSGSSGGSGTTVAGRKALALETQYMRAIKSERSRSKKIYLAKKFANEAFALYRANRKDLDARGVFKTSIQILFAASKLVSSYKTVLSVVEKMLDWVKMNKGDSFVKALLGAAIGSLVKAKVKGATELAKKFLALFRGPKVAGQDGLKKVTKNAKASAKDIIAAMDKYENGLKADVTKLENKTGRSEEDNKQLFSRYVALASLYLKQKRFAIAKAMLEKALAFANKHSLKINKGALVKMKQGAANTTNKPKDLLRRLLYYSSDSVISLGTVNRKLTQSEGKSDAITLYYLLKDNPSLLAKIRSTGRQFYKIFRRMSWRRKYKRRPAFMRTYRLLAAKSPRPFKDVASFTALLFELSKPHPKPQTTK